MSNDDLVAFIRALIEWAALGIEMIAVVVIVTGVIRVAFNRGTIRYLTRLDGPDADETSKHQLGKTMLLGLEFLVAADVVRTVALAPTLSNVAILGVLVVIRTFLSWSLTVEIEGRWPWQARAARNDPETASDPDKQ
jgi:uncharacterized membrane protein